jgi:hypothetical protein
VLQFRVFGGRCYGRQCFAGEASDHRKVA